MQRQAGRSSAREPERTCSSTVAQLADLAPVHPDSHAAVNSFQVMTWYVSPAHPTCWHPQLVTVSGDALTWEAQLYGIHGSPLLRRSMITSWG